MARNFELPDLGEGIHEAEIQQVLVESGDEVEEGQNILEVETDKATVDVPSPFSGTIQDILVEPGDIVRVGDALMRFSGGEEEEVEEEEKPEAEAEPREKAERKEPAKARVETPERKAEAEVEAEAEAEELKGPVPASPATRRLAREMDVNLRAVYPGSGPGGRVTSEDVRSFAEEGPPEKKKPAPPEEKVERPEKRAVPALERPAPELPDFSRWGRIERVPLRSVRREIAKKMTQARNKVPHAVHFDEADVTELERMRSEYKGEVEEGSLTLMVFVMKAVAAALKQFPRFNASLDADEGEIILKQYYNVGIAVDTDRGLIVPVIRDVDRKSITELAGELKEIVERTREGEASLQELQGGTISITNIGALGGTSLVPIVNYPEVAVLGMAKADWKPVVQTKNGSGQMEIIPRMILPLVLSFDHRVLDGADAARFTNMIIDMLEDPDEMILHM